MRVQVPFRATPEYGLRIILGFVNHTSFLVPLDNSVKLARATVENGVSKLSCLTACRHKIWLYAHTYAHSSTELMYKQLEGMHNLLPPASRIRKTHHLF